MSVKLSWGITAIALFFMGLMYWTQNEVLEQGAHVFRPVQPLSSHNTELTNRKRVPLSDSIALLPDQLVDISEYPLGEINIQKLTENSYWILHNLHAMTLYVGESEVLLVDAPEDLFVDRLLDRYQQVFPRPTN
jgi:hypothetical protein